MSAEYQAKQAALVAEHIKKQDIVITTALIPGRPAPKLVTEAMVASMKPGSVLVDLAVERGGNVEGAEARRDRRQAGGVKIVGYTNVAGRHRGERLGALRAQPLRLRRDADRQGRRKVAIDWDDELVKATNLTRDGAVVHPAFSGKGA